MSLINTDSLIGIGSDPVASVVPVASGPSTRVFADAEIRLYNQASIPRRAVDGYVIADLLSEIFKNGFGDSQGVQADAFSQLNPTISAPWGASGGAITSQNNLDFVRFLANGEVRFGVTTESEGPARDLAGVVIAPRDAPLDLKIGANAATIPATGTAQNWTAVSGTWQTGLKINPRGGTALLNTGNDAVAIARSSGTVAANRSFRGDVGLQGFKNSGADPYLRYIWGGEWSLVLPIGGKPRIERLMPQGQTQKWFTLKTLHLAPSIVRGGRYRFLVLRLAGRLVVQFEGVAVWLLDTKGAANAAAYQAENLREVSWAQAPHQIELENLRARVEVGHLKWASASGVKATGTLTRAARRIAPLPSGGDFVTGGWKREGAAAALSVATSPGLATYTLTLTGSDSNGISSPFIDKAVMNWAPVWAYPGPNYIDVRGACAGVDLTFVAPPDGAGASGQITLDRTLLDDFYGANWPDYAQIWNPIEVYVKRNTASFTRLFSGYIFKPSMGSAVGVQRSLTLTVRDAMVRLQKVGECNNAPIDQNYPPLDLLFARKFSGDNSGYDAAGHPVNGSLYLAECVQAIVRIALGDAVADAMNGNGDPLRFLPADHPPVITTRSDACGWSNLDALGGQTSPLGVGGWLLPPPYGSAAYDWISDLARRDRCVFYFGWPTADTSGSKCLIYGRLPNIIGQSNFPLHVLKDTLQNGNWQRLLMEMQNERRPERDINTVDAWSLEDPNLAGILPAMRMATDTLPDDDPRSAARTWPRHYIIREPLALLGAEAIATATIGQLTGVLMQWPTFTFEGDERIGLGHLVMASLLGPVFDGSIDLHNRYYRAQSITHRLNFRDPANSYTMTVQPRPLTSGEDAAFRAANGLPLPDRGGGAGGGQGEQTVAVYDTLGPV